MVKKLTLAAVKKNHANVFHERTKITLSNGDYIHIQNIFKTTSIQRMLLEYMEILEELKKKKVNFDHLKGVTFVYYMLLLKHFTDLNHIPKDIEKMIVVCEELINLDLLEEIMNAFPEDQLEKIQMIIEKTTENSEVLEKQWSHTFERTNQ